MKPGYISIYDLRLGLLKIREAAAQTGLTQRAIRYYESLGLIADTKRSRGKIRLYTTADCQRLSAIKQWRAAGKSLAEIQTLLTPVLQAQRVLFLDSAFSLPVMRAQELGCVIIPDTVTFGTTVYKDYTTLSPEAYLGVRARKRHQPITEPPTVEEYITLFLQAVAQGCHEIVSLHPDQRLSRSYERARAAA